MVRSGAYLSDLFFFFFFLLILKNKREIYLQLHFNPLSYAPYYMPKLQISPSSEDFCPAQRCGLDPHFQPWSDLNFRSGAYHFQKFSPNPFRSITILHIFGRFCRSGDRHFKKSVPQHRNFTFFGEICRSAEPPFPDTKR